MGKRITESPKRQISRLGCGLKREFVLKRVY